MCKVTCLIKNNNIVLTSSRDISINRKHSLPPKRFKYNNKKLIMPFDPQGSGTWIGAGNHKIICLLNQTGKEDVSTSRGQLVVKFISGEMIIDNLENELNMFNSFRLIYLDIKSKKYYNYIWNGADLVINEISNHLNIWFSNTIYNEMEIDKQTKIFLNQYNSNVNKDKLLKFHTKKNNILTSGSFITTSITQIYYHVNANINYNDLINNKQYQLKFLL